MTKHRRRMLTNNEDLLVVLGVAALVLFMIAAGMWVADAIGSGALR